jgi:hypothetical protein
MGFEEKLKSLENSKNFLEMINELRQNESSMTLWYAKLSSLTLEEYPETAGVLQSLEELSQTMTTLLRKCALQLDETYSPIPVEIQASTTISSPQPDSISRDRDDIFSLSSLRTLLNSYPPKEATSTEQETLKFWYIMGGQNESVELSFPANEYFGNALMKVLSQIEGVSEEEEFSVSPLGYDPLLLPQFENAVSQVLTSYADEFTLIKFYR